MRTILQGAPLIRRANARKIAPGFSVFGAAFSQIQSGGDFTFTPGVNGTALVYMIGTGGFPASFGANLPGGGGGAGVFGACRISDQDIITGHLGASLGGGDGDDSYVYAGSRQLFAGGGKKGSAGVAGAGGVASGGDINLNGGSGGLTGAAGSAGDSVLGPGTGAAGGVGATNNGGGGGAASLVGVLPSLFTSGSYLVPGAGGNAVNPGFGQSGGSIGGGGGSGSSGSNGASVGGVLIFVLKDLYF